MGQDELGEISMNGRRSCILICGLFAAWTLSVAIIGNHADARHGCYWVFGKSVKKIDVHTLVSLGTTDVFLHENTVTSHGQKEFESWIAQAAAAGLNVHIWMQTFYNGKWVNPVKDGKPDRAFFDETIARAQSYARIPGVGGIHFDEVRYPRTAFKTPGGTAAISEFVRLAATRLHQTFPRLVVSMALMPKKAEGAYYYGQDYATISKYMDVVIPMTYKGNYQKSRYWIATTIKWYVDHSKGARVWAGLQGYKSEKDPSLLPIPEITADVKAALDAGAVGAVIFRWGVTNLIDFTLVRRRGMW